MVPVLKNFPLLFLLLFKNFCFSLLFFGENFQYLITFNEVSESVDGLQIRVNLANPKIKNSVVIIFDSNSSNFWRIRKISYHYHFLFKSYCNLKYLRIFTDFRPFTNKMYGKNTHRIYVQSNCVKDFNGFALPCCRYNGFLKIQLTMSMSIRQFDFWITS